MNAREYLESVREKVDRFRSFQRRGDITRVVLHGTGCGFPYHIVIGEDGALLVTKRESEVCKPYHTDYEYHIALVNRSERNLRNYTRKQYVALEYFLGDFMAKHLITEIVSHESLNRGGKECPNALDWRLVELMLINRKYQFKKLGEMITEIEIT